MVKLVKERSYIDEFITWSAIVIILLIPLFFWPRPVASQYPLIWIYLIPKAVILRLGCYFLALLLVIRTGLKLSTRDYDWRPSLPQILAVTFLAALWLVSRFALNQNFAWYGSLFWLEGFYTYANYIFIFILATVFGSKKVFERLVKGLTLTTIFISAYAIVEAYYPQIQAFTNVGFAGRSGSTSGNAVIFGAYLVMPLLLITGFLLQDGFENKFWRSAGFVGLTLSIPALVFTFSRGAWLAVFIGLLLLLNSSRQRLRHLWQDKKLAFVLVLAISVLIIYFGPRAGQLWPRAFSAFNPTEATAQTRVVLWRQALKIIAKYPLTGTGVDSYAYAVAKHFPASQALALDKPHNYFLELMVTLGIPTAFIYFVWLATVFIFLQRRWLDQNNLFNTVSPALAAYLVAIFFLFSSINNAPLFYFLAGLGLTSRARPQNRS